MGYLIPCQFSKITYGELLTFVCQCRVLVLNGSKGKCVLKAATATKSKPQLQKKKLGRGIENTI